MVMLVKTKDLMIDVARQLFARSGVQNTTMNDIADAAQRGRRTLYTYFKNKEDIYQAVIERELEHLRRELEIARRVPLPPDEKLINLIYAHLEAMKAVVLRNGTLRADFFRDIWSVQRARAEFDLYEQRLIEEVLLLGVEQGVFDIPHISTMAYLLQNAIKGLEVPFISGHVRHRSGDAEYQQVRENVCHLIMRGIRRSIE
ncbi:MAG: TetR/AcrR family transcriptional regulator [Porphyromonadaceae bacterium]|nr:TetR/AcrR family transcriptional regulator [Porphyromonadaceae bacterium]